MMGSSTHFLVVFDPRRSTTLRTNSILVFNPLPLVRPSMAAPKCFGDRVQLKFHTQLLTFAAKESLKV